MTISADLFRAVLATDSYNGDNAGLDIAGNQIGKQRFDRTLRVHRFYERCGFRPGLRTAYVARRPQ